MPPNVQLIETGIDRLDKALSGGLPLNEFHLISGPSGSGKTVLATRIAIEALKAGINVVYISTIEHGSILLQGLKKSYQGYIPLIDSKLFKMLDFTRVYNIFADAQASIKNLKQLMTDLITSVEHELKGGTSLLIMDTLSNLFPYTLQVELKADLVRQLVSTVLSKKNVTFVATALPDLSDYIAPLAHTHISLRFVDIMGKQIRLLTIKKSRWRPTVQESFRLEFKPSDTELEIILEEYSPARVVR